VAVKAFEQPTIWRKQAKTLLSKETPWYVLSYSLQSSSAVATKSPVRIYLASVHLPDRNMAQLVDNCSIKKTTKYADISIMMSARPAVAGG